MTKLLLPAPPNEYVKAISYPQRNLDSVFSTLLELKEMVELLGGLREKSIGRAALWEELETRYKQLLAGIANAAILNWPHNGTQIIASDAITIDASGGWGLDTEGSAATDDLSTINGAVLGRIITLNITSSGRNVTVKSGIGNIDLAKGDFTFDLVQDRLMLIASGSGRWRELSRAGVTENFATTTEILTGIDNRKTVTPDALAALWEKGTDLTAAATLVVPDGGFFSVGGAATSITDIDFATSKQGRAVWFRFGSSGITLVHSASLTLPGVADIVTVAGDFARFVQWDGSDTVYCTAYMRADGSSLAIASTTDVLTGTNTKDTVTPDALAALWERGVNITLAGGATDVPVGEGGYVWLTGAGNNIATFTFTPHKTGRTVRFLALDAFTLVNGANLGLPVGNISVNTFDTFDITCHSTAPSVRLTHYQRQNGAPLTLTGMLASTTEALLGVEATKALTADANAATWEYGGVITAAATTNIPDGGSFLINNGPVSITAFSVTTYKSGRRVLLNFNVANVTLVHSASLQIPGSANITPATGDCVELWFAFGSTSAVVTNWRKSNGKPVVFQTATETPSTATGNIVATNVQAAIAELEAEKYNDTGGTVSGSMTVTGSVVFQSVFTNERSGTTPTLSLSRPTDTLVADDVVGSVLGRGLNTTPGLINFVQLLMRVTTMTAGAESGYFAPRIVRAGTARDVIILRDGVVVGGASGGDKGLGTLNAVGVYDDSVLLTCMALEENFRATGKFSEADIARWDAMVPDTIIEEIDDEIEIEPAVEATETTEAKPAVKQKVHAPRQVIKREHHTARVFQKLLDEGLDPQSAKSFADHLDNKRSLPGMPSMDEWVHNQISSGEMISRLWLSAEIMSLSVANIEKRLAALEGK